MLVPKADHVPDDQKAIFHRLNTSTFITMADVMDLERNAAFER